MSCHLQRVLYSVIFFLFLILPLNLSSQITDFAFEYPDELNLELALEEMYSTSTWSNAEYAALLAKYDKLWDDELNHIYQKLLKILQEDKKKALIEAQRGWLEYYLNEKEFFELSFYSDPYDIDFVGKAGYFSFLEYLIRLKKDRTIRLILYYYMLTDEWEFLIEQ